jgi:prevent-host-death family protein
MTQISIAEAKNALTRLIHEAEQGQAIHITRRGKPVAVLVSEDEYERLKTGEKKKDFWQAIQEMRADPNFEPVDLSLEEVDSWRDKSPGREFSWED